VNGSPTRRIAGAFKGLGVFRWFPLSLPAGVLIGWLLGKGCEGPCSVQNGQDVSWFIAAQVALSIGFILGLWVPLVRFLWIVTQGTPRMVRLIAVGFASLIGCLVAVAWVCLNFLAFAWATW